MSRSTISQRPRSRRCLHALDAYEREFADYARRIRQRLISLRRHRALPKGKVEPLPDIEQRLGQRVNQRIMVVRRGGDAKTLRPPRHGRIVDRLNVDAVVREQKVGGRLALLGLAYEYGRDVRIVRHDRQAGGVEHGFDARSALLMTFALET